MAVDMFMKIDNVKGEAQDKAYKDKIDVLAWSWGASNAGSAHVGGGAGTGRVNVQDLSFTKYVDSATAELMKRCCDGKHFKEAMLIVRKAGEKPVEYLKITMNQVYISSVSTGGSGGEDRLTENVTLNFAKVKVEYTPQTATGSSGATQTMGWDIAQNAPFG
jgi:type VI secretion system secreted protein Hcp